MTGAFQARHADQDYADAGSVIEVADVLKRGGREPFGFIDNEDLGRVGRKPGLDNHVAADMAVDADAHAVDEPRDVAVQFAEGAAHCGVLLLKGM